MSQACSMLNVGLGSFTNWLKQDLIPHLDTTNKRRYPRRFIQSLATFAHARISRGQPPSILQVKLMAWDYAHTAPGDHYQVPSELSTILSDGKVCNIRAATEY